MVRKMETVDLSFLDRFDGSSAAMVPESVLGPHVFDVPAVDTVRGAFAVFCCLLLALCIGARAPGPERVVMSV